MTAAEGVRVQIEFLHGKFSFDPGIVQVKFSVTDVRHQSNPISYSAAAVDPEL